MKAIAALLLGFLLASPGIAPSLLAQGADKPADTPIDLAVSVEIDFGYFHERLSPYGEWEEVADHGWCWSPRDMDVDWRPYSHGNWLYADDCGWYWHDDYEWGWAGHHYGRWVTVGPRWHWVPGYEWSGGWVAWRHGGGYVGWAPLSPSAHWEVGVGIRMTGYSHETHIHEGAWVFVGETSFTNVNVHSVLIKSGQNGVIIQKTKVQGSVSVSGGIIVNTSITVDSAARITGKKITHHKVQASRTLGGSKLANDEGQIRVFRPKVTKSNAKPQRGNDKERNDANTRKTLKEKHEAEGGELDERHNKSGKDETGRKADRDDMESRHKREEADHEKRNGNSNPESGKKPTHEPDKESGKKPEREPEKESGKKPEHESEKKSGKKPEKDPGSQGGKGKKE